MTLDHWLLIGLLAIGAYGLRLAGLFGGQAILQNARLKTLLDDLPGESRGGDRRGENCACSSTRGGDHQERGSLVEARGGEGMPGPLAPIGVPSSSSPSPDRPTSSRSPLAPPFSRSGRAMPVTVSRHAVRVCDTGTPRQVPSLCVSGSSSLRAWCLRGEADASTHCSRSHAHAADTWRTRLLCGAGVDVGSRSRSPNFEVGSPLLEVARPPWRTCVRLRKELRAIAAVGGF